jgi:S1-C subfamily serine protease
MDIEQLNKSQIVLLVLLVSFVTSMATGIVTVTLMDQAPQGMTYTINRFIEQTAEAVDKVIPNADGTTSTQTVIVSEDNAIAQAVAGASASLVRVYTLPTDSKEKIGDVVAVGFVAFDDHTIITDASGIVKDGSYLVRLTDGRIISAKTIAQDESNGFAILTLTLSEGQSGPTPIPFVEDKGLHLGQSVTVLGGREGDEIATGIVTKVSEGAPVSTNIIAGARFSGGVALTVSGKSAGIVIVHNGTVDIVPTALITALRAPKATP